MNIATLLGFKDATFTLNLIFCDTVAPTKEWDGMEAVMADSQKMLATEVLTALLEMRNKTDDIAADCSRTICNEIWPRYDHCPVRVELNNARADSWFALARLAGALNSSSAASNRDSLQDAAIEAAERWQMVA